MPRYPKRVVRRRRSTTPRRVRAPVKRRNVRGTDSFYANNPLELLKLNRPNHRNTPIPKRYVPPKPDRGKQLARSALGVAGRNLRALGHFANRWVPFGLGGLAGDLINGGLNYAGKKISKSAYKSKNKVANAALSFLDGQQREGSINKYTDALGKLLLDKGDNIINDLPEFIENAYDKATHTIDGHYPRKGMKFAHGVYKLWKDGKPSFMPDFPTHFAFPGSSFPKQRPSLEDDWYDTEYEDHFTTRDEPWEFPEPDTPNMQMRRDYFDKTGVNYDDSYQGRKERAQWYDADPDEDGVGILSDGEEYPDIRDHYREPDEFNEEYMEGFQHIREMEEEGEYSPEVASLLRQVHAEQVSPFKPKETSPISHRTRARKPKKIIFISDDEGEDFI